MGKIQLENRERVFVTWLVRPMDEATRRYLVTLRAAGILDANGNPIEKVGMFAFGTEPNPDVDDGTY